MADSPFPLDPGNAEQAGSWDGEDGAYWATYHREYERLLGVFDTTLVEAGGVGRGDRVLDIGCGTGATTRALAARATDGTVLGLDLSGPMLVIARRAAERAGVHNVEFVQGDAQVYRFDPETFDVAISRMGCMFFADPVRAFANIGTGLRPGGRLALTVWQTQSANGWITAIDGALGEPPPAEDDPADYTPGPFSLADAALCTSFLERAGFRDANVTALDTPLAFGSVDDAQAFLETWIEEDDPEARSRASASLRRLLSEHATADQVLLPSATWLVTARRPKDAGRRRRRVHRSVDPAFHRSLVASVDTGARGSAAVSSPERHPPKPTERTTLMPAVHRAGPPLSHPHHRAACPDRPRRGALLLSGQ